MDITILVYYRNYIIVMLRYSRVTSRRYYTFIRMRFNMNSELYSKKKRSIINSTKIEMVGF